LWVLASTAGRRRCSRNPVVIIIPNSIIHSIYSKIWSISTAKYSKQHGSFVRVMVWAKMMCFANSPGGFLERDSGTSSHQNRSLRAPAFGNFRKFVTKIMHFKHISAKIKSKSETYYYVLKMCEVTLNWWEGRPPSLPFRYALVLGQKCIAIRKLISSVKKFHFRSCYFLRVVVLFISTVIMY